MGNLGYGTIAENGGKAVKYKDTNAEIERTKQVIADRTAAGMDLSKQYEHYRNLTGKDFEAPTVKTSTPVYSAPQRNVISFDEASNRAKQQVDPLYQRALENIKTQKYQNEVNSGEISAKRGLSHSGLAADQLTKIAIASQGQVADAESERAAKIASMAQAIVDRDEDLAFRERQQAFQEYLGQEGLKLNRDQFDYGKSKDDKEYNYRTGRDSVMDSRYSDETAYNRGRDAIGDKRYNQEWDYNVGRDKVADSRYNQEWNYQVGRDKISDSQWQKQFDEDARRFGLNYALEKQREARIGSVGSNGYPSGVDNSPKSKDQSYTDWLGFFNQNKDSINNKGIAEFEKELKTKAKEYEKMGYNIDAVIDAMYAGASNGRFRTKLEYENYSRDALKQYHDSGNRPTR